MKPLAYFLLTVQAVFSLFLIGLILLQRGRGGGLAGSLGGMGGQSAFGTKAGDFFTRLTIIVALIWFALAGVNVIVVDKAEKGRFSGGKNVGAEAIKSAPANDTKSGDSSKPSEESNTDKPVEKTDVKTGEGDKASGNTEKSSTDGEKPQAPKGDATTESPKSDDKKEEKKEEPASEKKPEAGDAKSESDAPKDGDASKSKEPSETDAKKE